MKIFSILILSILLSLEGLLSQDYLWGQITFNDGAIEEGYIRPFFYDDTKIYFKKDLQEKDSKFKSTELEEIALIDESDTLVFHKYALARYMMGGNKLIHFDGRCWATKTYETDQIEAFQFAVKNSKEGLNILNSLINPSSLIMGFYNHKMSFGIRFPEKEEIIDVAPNKGTNGMDGNQFRRRLKKYLSRNCIEFRKSVWTDDSDSIRDLEAYLDHYSETCK